MAEDLNRPGVAAPPRPPAPRELTNDDARRTLRRKIDEIRRRLRQPLRSRPPGQASWVDQPDSRSASRADSSAR